MKNITNWLVNDDEKINKIVNISSHSWDVISGYKQNIKNELKAILTQNLTIIEDHLGIMNRTNPNKKYLSLFKETMEQLGFKELQIKYALENIKINENIEQCVEDAIKLIALKNKFDKEYKEIN